ncbi:MAG: ATP-binding protein [Vulcanimicrobiota bacterium]
MDDLAVGYNSERARGLLSERQQEIHRRTDRLFGRLLAFEWLWAVVSALLVSPRTWIGDSSSPHIHLIMSVLLGGVIISLPQYLIRHRPGEPVTRYTIACAQMLISSLLIHTSGGRIETHFHIFGSLAFLGFYRDWKVFLPATLVVIVDHWLRGWLYPMSVFGVAEQASWRWLEHTSWVLFCDFFLIHSARQSQLEMCQLAIQQARLEAHNLAQLQAEQEHFRLAFENAPIGMALLDSRGSFMRVNEVTQQILGYSPGELNSLKLNELMEAEVEPGGVAREVRLRRGNGEWVWVLLSLSCCAQLSIAQMVDLSQRKRTEKALQQAQKLESVGLLARGIAHEINTPIQYIGDNLRFLKESLEELGPLLNGNPVNLPDLNFLKQEIPQAIDHSLEGVERVSKIVRSMREYSQAGPAEMGGANLNHLIENALTISRNEWKYVAEVDVQFESDLPEVRCDRAELGRVILHLLVNAADSITEKYAHTGKTGHILIKTQSQGEGVIIRIQDDGIGIPPALRQKIFEPFFTTKEVGKGTGQGLAIAQAAVIRHGGRLEVESEPGAGATFSIHIPRQSSEVSR